MITESQRIERRKGIGGSDMPIILGLSSYKTPYQLYLEKCGLLDDSREESQVQYWGNQLEVVIRKEFRKRNRVKVETPDTQIHPFYDFLRGNLDGWIPKWNAVFEVKCSHAFMGQLWGESGSDVIPMEYLVQVAFYCSVMNASEARIAVLIGGNDYREFRYLRDLELEQTIIDAACGFWEAVRTQSPPPATSQVDLKIMFPRHNPGSMKSINKDIKTSWNQLKDAKAKMKELQVIEDDAKFKIMNYMESAECLVDENDKPLVTWKANAKGSRTFLLKGV
jgi:putative phage-type endonuclease